jgi:hypothetical protein
LSSIRLQVILEITDYARCNDLLHDSKGNPIEANTCHVPFRFGSMDEEGKGQTGGGSTANSRSRKKGHKKR